MSQQNIQAKKAKTVVGLETTFGSTPSTTYSAIPVNGSVSFELSQTEIENEDESIKLYDKKTTVRGLKGGSVKFDMYIKPYSTALSSSNAPTDHYVQQILKSFFGGHRVHSGSLVQAAATTTSVPMDSGATRSLVGQWLMFSGSAGLEPAYVKAMSSNTATVIPALTSIPASASVVVNGDTFYPTETNTNSLTIQHAKADSSNFQWQANGCLPKSLDIKVERDGLVMMSAEYEAATWITGSVVGLTTTSLVTETQTTPFAGKDAVFILQPLATTTRTHLPLESFAIKLNTGMEFIPDLGSTEGKVGTMRTGERLFAEATVKFRADVQEDFDWNAQTDLQMHLMIPKTTAEGIKRWICISIPTANIVGKPKWSDTNGRLTCEVVLHSKLNALTTSPTTDLGYAPFTLALL